MFRLSPEAETELDDIWIHIALDSASTDVATRIVDNITERFWLLAQHPFIGRLRDEDLHPGKRSLAADDYVIIHRATDDGVVLILHIVHGKRDLFILFRG
jgi:plasmid stabilization system protein ParE